VRTKRLNSSRLADPIGSKQTPPVLRAPNGVLQDMRNYWVAGKALYDPGDIHVPTLLIHAEWDAELLCLLSSGIALVRARGDNYRSGPRSDRWSLDDPTL
jgi:hypothetical protein